MAHPKHEDVRRRFQGRCGYCGVSETESRGELTTDHFQPTSAGGAEEDANLVYACFRCNTYKSDFFPSAADVARGLRLLHPLLDDFTMHLQENPRTGELEPLTETGRFHLTLLHLNRPALVQARLQRNLESLLTRQLLALRVENESLWKTISRQEVCIAALERLLGMEDYPGDG